MMGMRFWGGGKLVLMECFGLGRGGELGLGGGFGFWLEGKLGLLGSFVGGDRGAVAVGGAADAIGEVIEGGDATECFEEGGDFEVGLLEVGHGGVFEDLGLVGGA